ncbi:hypothetical protein TGRUB_237120 [Toxoplasma gondii RUB]|uniref:Uncharacterized protein n=1 Tax=Toxoplasma gondii RUB TaxID=935652 RepID=A0A086LN80_TOXGO|nr:hypothetical protein TGRUB_237120 [Toxoplasma gondii RUB]
MSGPKPTVGEPGCGSLYAPSVFATFQLFTRFSSGSQHHTRISSSKRIPKRAMKWCHEPSIFEKPTFIYKLYTYHDIHLGSLLPNVSLYGINGSDSCWPGTCLVTG